jgi:large repetitive protein
VARDDALATDEDTLLTGNVLANDTDPDGDTLTAVQESAPSHGTLTLNADGSFSYEPAANFNGSDSFTYKATDGSADSDVATVNIAVNPVNDAPVNSVPANPSTNEDTALTFNSANNNAISISDVDAGTSEVQVALSVDKGKLTLNGTSGLTFSNGDGTDDAAMTFKGTIAAINSALSGLNYDPDANFEGSLTLTITTNDQGNTGSGGQKSDTDLVNVIVTPVNDAPVAQDDLILVGEGDTVGGNVLANDSDPDGNPLEAVLVSGPANGTLTLNNANGTFSYTHNGSETTSDSFTYKASDGGLDSNVATVNITVTPVNDAPTVKVAAGGACGTNDRSGQINLTVENPDGPEGSLTLSAASRTRDQALLPNQNLVPVHTTAPTWTLSATALSGMTGTARITVTVSDGQDTGTVDVTVTVDGNGSKTTNGTGGADLLFGQNRRAKRLGWQRPPLRRKGQRHPQRRSGR